VTKRPAKLYVVFHPLGSVSVDEVTKLIKTKRYGGLLVHLLDYGAHGELRRQLSKPNTARDGSR
jgi:hypothetical protein